MSEHIETKDGDGGTEEPAGSVITDPIQIGNALLRWAKRMRKIDYENKSNLLDILFANKAINFLHPVDSLDTLKKSGRYPDKFFDDVFSRCVCWKDLSDAVKIQTESFRPYWEKHDEWQKLKLAGLKESYEVWTRKKYGLPIDTATDNPEQSEDTDTPEITPTPDTSMNGWYTVTQAAGLLSKQTWWNSDNEDITKRLNTAKGEISKACGGEHPTIESIKKGRARHINPVSFLEWVNRKYDLHDRDIDRNDPNRQDSSQHNRLQLDADGNIVGCAVKCVKP